MLSNENLYNAYSLGKKQTTTATTRCIRICILIMNINGPRCSLYTCICSNWAIILITTFCVSYERSTPLLCSPTCLPPLFAIYVSVTAGLRLIVSMAFLPVRIDIPIFQPPHTRIVCTKNQNENADRATTRTARCDVRMNIQAEQINKDSVETSDWCATHIVHSPLSFGSSVLCLVRAAAHLPALCFVPPYIEIHMSHSRSFFPCQL